VCALEQKNYEMNKCLSLVHLTSTVGLNQALRISQILSSQDAKT
jgi:hypothetical protein